MAKLQGTVTDQYGNVVAGASVAIRDHDTGAPAQLLADDGITTLANPLTTNAAGHWEAVVATGEYDYTVTYQGVSLHRTRVSA